MLWTGSDVEWFLTRLFFGPLLPGEVAETVSDGMINDSSLMLGL